MNKKEQKTDTDLEREYNRQLAKIIEVEMNEGELNMTNVNSEECGSFNEVLMDGLGERQQELDRIEELRLEGKHYKRWRSHQVTAQNRKRKKLGEQKTETTN